MQVNFEVSSVPPETSLSFVRYPAALLQLSVAQIQESLFPLSGFSLADHSWSVFLY